MRTIGLAALALGVALATSAFADGKGVCLASKTRGQPKAVADFIVRQNTCLVFGGDEPVPPSMARSPKTPKAIRDLKCDRLQPDEAALRRLYAHKPAVLHALDEAGNELC
ncbi:MAG: hypothetical protein ACHP7N_06700 [Caulobacterales bacterium]